MRPMKDIMATLPNLQLIIVMFVTTMLVQSANMSIDPIVSLYVKSMMPGAQNIAFFAGVVAASPGLGTLAASSYIGHKMDQIGPRRFCLGLLAGAPLLCRWPPLPVP